MGDVAPFRPAPALSDPHCQTLGAAIIRRYPGPPLQRERVELPDGDFLDLDWGPRRAGGPLVVVLHGLAGCSRSNYAGGMLRAAVCRDWQGVVMHFRGCSGEPNRQAKSYCAGDTDDLAVVLGLLRARHAKGPMFAVGYSLGGSVLLKWLGETGEHRLLQAAAAVSVPFRLADAANRMNRGWSRLYQRHLLRRLQHAYAEKFRDRDDAPLTLGQVARLNTFWEFDDQVTAPLHGYSGVDEYYRRASCRGYLHGVRVPTLIVHALDDPFMLRESGPSPGEVSDQVTLELSRHGGHVGFIGGSAWRPSYWLEQRIPAYLGRHLGVPTPEVPIPEHARACSECT